MNLFPGIDNQGQWFHFQQSFFALSLAHINVALGIHWHHIHDITTWDAIFLIVMMLEVSVEVAVTTKEGCVRFHTDNNLELISCLSWSVFDLSFFHSRRAVSPLYLWQTETVSVELYSSFANVLLKRRTHLQKSRCEIVISSSRTAAVSHARFCHHASGFVPWCLSCHKILAIVSPSCKSGGEQLPSLLFLDGREETETLPPFAHFTWMAVRMSVKYMLGISSGSSTWDHRQKINDNPRAITVSEFITKLYR